MPPKSIKTQVKETKETKPKKVVPKKTKKEPEPEPVIESDDSEQEYSEQEHSEQEHSDQEHSDQEDDKWEEDESEMLRVKAQRQQETKEIKEVKEIKEAKEKKASVEVKQEELTQKVQTFKKPQGRRFNTSGDSTQPTGKFHNSHNSHNNHNNYNKTNDNSTFKKPRSAALSFAYKDYRELTHPASNVTTVDLLRMLIVRSSDDGQTKLKHCLEDTLRAINLECKFPTIPRFASQSTQL